MPSYLVWMSAVPGLIWPPRRAESLDTMSAGSRRDVQARNTTFFSFTRTSKSITEVAIISSATLILAHAFWTRCEDDNYGPCLFQSSSFPTTTTKIRHRKQLPTWQINSPLTGRKICATCYNRSGSTPTTTRVMQTTAHPWQISIDCSVVRTH